MASIADILPAEVNFLETMRDLGGSGGRFIWTISLQGGHWTIGWADEQNELIATGEGSTFAEAWAASESKYDPK